MPDRTSHGMVDGLRCLRVLRAVTAALQPPRLILALVMVLTLAAAGGTWDRAATPRIPAGGLFASDGAVPPDEQLGPARSALAALEATHLLANAATDPDGARAELEALVAVRRARGEPADAETVARAYAGVMSFAPRGVYAATADESSRATVDVVRGVVGVRPLAVARALERLLVDVPAALWSRERPFAISFGFLLCVVIAIGGGALCRMAACERAGHERLSVRDACFFALSNWVKFIVALVLLPLIAGALGGLIALLGLTLAPWIDVLGGVLYGVMLALGFLVSFLMLGYAVSLPMLLPAVATENGDPLDAQQRGLAYVLKRPFQYVAAIAVAIIGLALGYVVVAVLAATVLNVTANLANQLLPAIELIGSGDARPFDLRPSGPGPAIETWHDGWAAALIAFWQRLVVHLVAAWVVAYVFSAATEVYLLLREVCDGQEPEDIWESGMIPGTAVPVPEPGLSPTARPGARDHAS